MHADGRMRITVRLVDAVRDEHVWARQFDERGANLLAIEGRAARAAAQEMAMVLSGSSDRGGGVQAEPLTASARQGVVARTR